MPRYWISAWNTSTPGYETGDAGNITVYYRADGAEVNLGNPTEWGGGDYYGDLTDAQFYAESWKVRGESSTVDVIIIGDRAGQVDVKRIEGADATDVLDGIADDACACVASRIIKSPAGKRCFGRGSDLTIVRGDTWEQSIDLGIDLTAAVEIIFTAKRDKDNTDAQADIKVSSIDGLEAINQTSATVPGNGSLTVTVAASGHILVRLEDVESAKLADSEGNWYWDAQVYDGTDTTTAKRGKLTVVGDVTLETYG